MIIVVEKKHKQKLDFGINHKVALDRSANSCPSDKSSPTSSAHHCHLTKPQTRPLPVHPGKVLTISCKRISMNFRHGNTRNSGIFPTDSLDGEMVQGLSHSFSVKGGKIELSECYVVVDFFKHKSQEITSISVPQFFCLRQMSELKLKPRKANSLIFQPEPLQVKMLPFLVNLLGQKAR